MENEPTEITPAQTDSLNEQARTNQIMFMKISYLLLVFFPIASIIYCLVCKQNLEKDAVLSSHCSWQIRTFCWCILGGGIVCFALIATLVGAIVVPFVALIVGIWLLVRVIKGFSRISRNEPMPS